MMEKQGALLKLNNRTKKQYCISSTCECGNHVLFWDFDNIELPYVLKSLSQIQSYHGLGDIYIIESENGYNAFCLDKFFLNEAHNILFYTRWNDFKHVKIGFISESWCLRVSDNKKIIDVIIPTENYDFRKQSTAHFECFKKLFNHKSLRINNPDNLTTIYRESYKQNRV